MSDMKDMWKQVKPKILPVILGGAAGMIWVYANYVPSSDVIASSPDRIIPAAEEMAEGALNPDLLEVRVCDADTDKDGKELLFVYDGQRQIGTVGSDKKIVILPYEPEEYTAWRCS